MPKAPDLKLISTDFDGTLFAEFENPPIPLELQHLIASLQAQGAKWVINTGRDMSSLMESLARAAIDIKPDYLVLVEREIHLHQEARYVGLEEWNVACRKVHAELFARIQPQLPDLIRNISSRFGASIYEDAFSPLCLIATSTAEMDAIHDCLDTFCQRVPGLTVVRNDVYARFSHVAYSKGTALGELTRRLGLNRSQVFAIGDHLNDLSMLSTDVAACVAAPSNAVPAVREAVRRAGGYYCRTPHGTGVAEAIKYYLAAATA